jgi:hypothetical protein
VKRGIYFNWLSLILFAANLAAVVAIYQTHFEGSWGGFFLFVLDFPASLLALLPVGWNPWLFFGVIGSLWWYLIGAVIFRWIKRKY